MGPSRAWPCWQEMVGNGRIDHGTAIYLRQELTLTWQLHEFDNDAALISRLAARIQEILVRSVENHGRASMAVSGGRTPAGLYRQLSRMELPWKDITISLVDERWVDEIHPDSNAALVAQTLLQGPASAARFIGMKTDASDPEAAEEELSAMLSKTILPLTVVILGMGEDGHTASLFPAASGTEAALSPDEPLLCRAIRIRGAPYGRMTLTARVLLSAEHRFLYVTGHTKHRVLRNALIPGSARELPVRAMLHAPAETEVYYSNDQEVS